MKIEFRLIDSDEMPPMVISENEDGNPKVTINSYHRIWISLHRRTIAGIIEALQGKMDEILQSYLEEQLKFQQMDREMV
jgi:hypothetical protein